MPSLTDGAIRRALKEVATTLSPLSLADGEGRGTGRLILVIRPMPNRVIADWMVQQWRDGQRSRKKIGTYPAMSLAQARDIYDRDFADAIQKGQSIKIVADARSGTVGDLFKGYVDHLKTSDAATWDQAKKILDKVEEVLGKHRPARDIAPDEVVAAIRPIFQRGAPSMADHVRATVRAAFSWGLKSELDYRNPSPRRFGLVLNPAAGIPCEPYVPGTRWLEESEFCRLYRWLECPDVPIHPPYPRAVRVLMLTGQRVSEIATLHKTQWNSRERLLDWSTTKNDRPHAAPVPEIAAEILDAIVPNEYGWLFPSAFDPSKPVKHTTLYSFMWRQRERGVIPIVTNRDLRRTWKTLAGKAGLSKEIRDRIQNHALQDVSSKHYDRWSYMPEKRAAMKQWNSFVTKMLSAYRRRLVA